MVLAAEAAEGADQRHIADDVDHLAVDGGGLVGEIVMQRLAGRGQAEHRSTMSAATTPRDLRPSSSHVASNAIAATVAAQGGSTFQMNMFSTVKMALDVAVMRLLNVPGRRSAK